MREWFDPEQRALIYLLRHCLGYAPAPVPADSYSNPFDWGRFIRLANHHRVAGLLHRCIPKDTPAHLPAPVMDALERAQIAQMALTMSHTRELKRIVQKLTDHHHAFLVHKGIPLAASVYPEMDCRPCGSDFDLFIKKQDEHAVIGILNTLGYHIEDSAYERINKKYTGEITLLRRTGNKLFMVDLHVEFAANAWARVTGFDMQDVWDHLACVEISGVHVPHLPPMPYFFFLATHCANHLFDGLITFCDLDLFIRKYAERIDWEGVVATARKTRSTKVLYYACAYTRMYLETPVPPDVLARLKPAAGHQRLMPEKRLLMRETAPPKYLKRYLHLVMLDHPVAIGKSLYHFTARHAREVLSRFDRLR